MVLRHPDFQRQPVWFQDRDDAGRQLAEVLERQPELEVDVVLAVPRGGLPVAAAVAERLRRPLDVLVARKIGVPGQPELAMGAVTRFGAIWNQDLLDMLHLPDEQREDARRDALEEVTRRERLYRGTAPPVDVGGRRVALVDDGLATGATMAAAVQAVQTAGAAQVVVAVAVASQEAVERMERHGAQVAAVAVPRDFMTVGQFFRDFRQVSDEECIAILERSRARAPALAPPASARGRTEPHEQVQMTVYARDPRGDRHVVGVPFDVDIVLHNDADRRSVPLSVVVNGTAWVAPMFAEPEGPAPDGLIRGDPVHVTHGVASLAPHADRTVRVHCRPFAATAGPNELLSVELWTANGTAAHLAERLAVRGEVDVGLAGRPR